MNDLEKLQNIRINYAFNKISDYRIDQELCAFVGLSLFGNILDDCSLFGAMFLCGCAIVKDLISIKTQTDILISKLYIYDGSEIPEKYKQLKEKYDIYLKKLAQYFKELDLKYEYEYKGLVPVGVNILRSVNKIQDEYQLVMEKRELAFNINTLQDAGVANKYTFKYNECK